MSSDILRFPGEALKRARTEGILVFHKLLLRVRDGYPVLFESNLDTWSFRAFGESLYGSNVSDLDFNGWRGQVSVDLHAILFDLQHADFLSLKKPTNRYM